MFIDKSQYFEAWDWMITKGLDEKQAAWLLRAYRYRKWYGHFAVNLVLTFVLAFATVLSLAENPTSYALGGLLLFYGLSYAYFASRIIAWRTTSRNSWRFVKWLDYRWSLLRYTPLFDNHLADRHASEVDDFLTDKEVAALIEELPMIGSHPDTLEDARCRLEQAAQLAVDKMIEADAYRKGQAERHINNLLRHDGMPLIEDAPSP